MFFIFGVQTIARDVKNSLPERAHCGRCGLISDFRHRRQRRYFTIFFLPVIPISKPEPMITCNRCGADYYSGNIAFGPAPGRTDDSGKTLLVYPGCSGKMRIPLSLDKAIRVRCPHCRDQFTVSVNRS